MTPAQLAWLEEHDGVLMFGTGKRVGLDFRMVSRPGPYLQVSAWTVDEAIAAARKLLEERGDR